jgi:hypothetical protein
MQKLWQLLIRAMGLSLQKRHAGRAAFHVQAGQSTAVYVAGETWAVI